MTAAAFGSALVLPFAGSAVAAVPVCACGGGAVPDADPPAPDPIDVQATTEAQPVPEHQAPPPPDPKPVEHQALRPTPEPPAPAVEPAESAAPADPPEPSPYAGMSADAAEHWAESDSSAVEPAPAPPQPEPEPTPAPAPSDAPSPAERQVQRPTAEPSTPAVEPEPAAPADPPESSPYTGMSADAAEHWADSDSSVVEPAPEPSAPEPAPAVEPPAPADSPEPSPYAGMSADAAEHWAESERSSSPEPPEAEPVPESPYDGMSADAAEHWAASEEEEEAAPPTVDGEVMTWNLGRGASWKHGQGTDPNELDEVAERIAEEEPDVVALQEVYTDFDIPATGEGDDVARLQEILREDHGLEYHSADGPASGIGDGKCELTDGFWLNRTVRCGNFGNAVLSLEPITSDENIHLPDDGDEGRTVMEAETTIGGVPVTINNTHVTTDDESDSGPTPQDRQIETVFDEAGDSSMPTILAGDFNAEPDEVHPDAERTGFEDLTDPDEGTACGGGDTPDEKIDYVLGRNGVTGSPQPIGDCDPSDHAPVVVDVSIPAEPAPGPSEGGAPQGLMTPIERTIPSGWCPLGHNPNGSCRGSGAASAAADAAGDVAERTWHVTRFAVNAPITAPTWLWAEANGGNCGFDQGLVVACDGVNSWANGPRGALTVGGTVLYEDDASEVSDAERAHEETHTDQWALFGLGLPALYFGNEAVSQVSGHGSCWNLFERWAGFEDGGYDECA